MEYQYVSSGGPIMSAVGSLANVIGTGVLANKINTFGSEQMTARVNDANKTFPIGTTTDKVAVGTAITTGLLGVGVSALQFYKGSGVTDELEKLMLATQR